jgi:hypothetical protein
MQIHRGTLVKGAGDSGWNLDTGAGTDRKATFDVDLSAFDFKKPPDGVLVALCYLDCIKDENVRIEVGAKDVSQEKFTVVFHTWSTSLVHKAGVSWIAFEV